ncbi:MAG: LemA family protein [Armatimonadota bacterium]|nr:LemA family protein [Armatimonadota bacterium]MDR7448657.1 LemA family protein [Armatimonadota bacterium]MDR7460309.1 LemA family protein [Armatimonadota bacterium]MDR7479001.1 LemA family protein [Armatimonadota bacterium]MDR7488480.1 LemA family protein [Armatimonadota bacterium]
MTGYLIAGAVVLVALYGVLTYNRLVVLRNRIDNAWSQIDVQLRRRYDLIPTLVETVRGYAGHEREVFERVTEARARAIAAGTVAEQGQAENLLTQALRTLFAVAENYPQLRASENFQRLQEELANTEGKIAFARQFYNDTVLRYENLRQSFPAGVLAGLFGFRPREYFEMEEAAREPVPVRFP